MVLRKGGLISSICRFPWCPLSRRGPFQGTNVTRTSVELGGEASGQLLGARVGRFRTRCMSSSHLAKASVPAVAQGVLCDRSLPWSSALSSDTRPSQGLGTRCSFGLDPLALVFTPPSGIGSDITSSLRSRLGTLLTCPAPLTPWHTFPGSLLSRVSLTSFTYLSCHLALSRGWATVRTGSLFCPPLCAQG